MDKPWLNEPDRLEFTFEGFNCLVIRNNLGSLCGYVGVPEGHSMYGMPYDSIDVSIHGGLTFSDYGTENLADDNIYYKPTKDSLGRRLYWIGFDCAHAGDYVPGMYELVSKNKHLSMFLSLFEKSVNEGYRDINYVVNEVKRLVSQLN